MSTRINKLLVTAAMTMALAACGTAEKNTPPPPKPAPQAAPTPPPPPPKKVEAPAPAPTYVIKDVHFEFDKSYLKPTAADTLLDVAAALREQPGVMYEVAGHTDSIGTDAYNQGLSERRAKSVHEFLTGHGVDSSRLTLRGYGESNPIASNATREGRAQNRRVEIRPRR